MTFVVASAVVAGEVNLLRTRRNVGAWLHVTHALNCICDPSSLRGSLASLQYQSMRRSPWTASTKTPRNCQV